MAQHILPACLGQGVRARGSFKCSSPCAVSVDAIKEVTSTLQTGLVSTAQHTLLVTPELQMEQWISIGSPIEDGVKLGHCREEMWPNTFD